MSRMMTYQEVIKLTNKNGLTPLKVNKLSGNNDNFSNELVGYGRLPTNDCIGLVYTININDMRYFSTSIVNEVIKISESTVIIKTNNSVYQIEVIC